VTRAKQRSTSLVLAKIIKRKAINGLGNRQEKRRKRGGSSI